MTVTPGVRRRAEQTVIKGDAGGQPAAMPASERYDQGPSPFLPYLPAGHRYVAQYYQDTGEEIQDREQSPPRAMPPKRAESPEPVKLPAVRDECPNCHEDVWWNYSIKKLNAKGNKNGCYKKYFCKCERCDVSFISSQTPDRGTFKDKYEEKQGYGSKNQSSNQWSEESVKKRRREAEEPGSSFDNPIIIPEPAQAVMNDMERGNSALSSLKSRLDQMAMDLIAIKTSQATTADRINLILALLQSKTVPVFSFGTSPTEAKGKEKEPFAQLFNDATPTNSGDQPGAR